MDKKRAQYINELRKDEFRVTIFGSARVKKGSELYREIYSLGKMLAERGIDIVTGGGPGLMAAASNGHKEGRKGNSDIHSIGLEIELPKEQDRNKGVDIMRKFGRFSNRLDNFMLLSNAIVVTPGGVGTLLELFYSWQLVQVNKIETIPIIVIGKNYKGLIKWLKKSPMKKGYFEEKDLELLFYCKNVRGAMRIIDKAYEEFKKRPRRKFKNKVFQRLKRQFS